MKVYQLTSPKSGREVPNQFEIVDGTTRTFQSYNSIIAKIELNSNNEPILILDPIYWNYSKTTSKYLNRFINDDELLTEIKKYAKKHSDMGLTGKTFSYGYASNTIVVFNNLN